NALAGLLAADKKPMQALHCLGTSLSLDRARPAAGAEAQKLLKANKFEAEAKAGAGLGIEAGSRKGKLPPPPEPASSDKKFSSKELFALAAPSVVVVQAGDATGSGVCVAKENVVVTNEHVIRGSDEVFVVPFELDGKEVKRLPRLRARVIFRSEKEDVAVVEVEKGKLKPLAGGGGGAGAGGKIVAVGESGWEGQG